jgi:hypothetical protein
MDKVQDPAIASVTYHQQNPPESTNNNVIYFLLNGARGSIVVKALCYKPEGRGFLS